MLSIQRKREIECGRYRRICNSNTNKWKGTAHKFITLLHTEIGCCWSLQFWIKKAKMYRHTHTVRENEVAQRHLVKITNEPVS